MEWCERELPRAAAAYGDGAETPPEWIADHQQLSEDGGHLSERFLANHPDPPAKPNERDGSKVLAKKIAGHPESPLGRIYRHVRRHATIPRRHRDDERKLEWNAPGH